MNLWFETDRLLMRPLEKGDVDICIELFTDPEVMRFIREPLSRELVGDQIEQWCQRAGAGCIGIWCLIDKITGEKLGTSVLLPLPIESEDTDWSLVRGAEIPPGEIEIGYILKRAAWRKGFATEACRRLLRFAFEESPLQEIVAVTHSENGRSQHVLTKCGFTNEGSRRAYNKYGVSGFRIDRSKWPALETLD